jgi:hypothetical protein
MLVVIFPHFVTLVLAPRGYVAKHLGFGTGDRNPTPVPRSVTNPNPEHPRVYLNALLGEIHPDTELLEIPLFRPARFRKFLGWHLDDLAKASPRFPRSNRSLEHKNVVLRASPRFTFFRDHLKHGALSGVDFLNGSWGAVIAHDLITRSNFVKPF